MKKKKNLKYRMYGLVNYQLSGIQKGIQFGHAVVEYGNKYHNTSAYRRWSKIDKTFIILNGGTTNCDYKNRGTLNCHLDLLEENNIMFANFNEPDLGDQLTAICFLVDERVWDNIKYSNIGMIEVGDPAKFPMNEKRIKLFDEAYGKGVGFMREFLKQFKLA